MVRILPISITDQQEAFANSLVDRGYYPDLSSIVQHGLDLLQAQLETTDTGTDTLRRLFDRRREGDFIPTIEMRNRIDRMIDRKRRELES